MSKKEGVVGCEMRRYEVWFLLLKSVDESEIMKEGVTWFDPVNES